MSDEFSVLCQLSRLNPSGKSRDVKEVSVDQTIATRMVKSQKGLFILDAQVRPEYRFHDLRELRAKSYLWAPMKIEGRMLGMLTLAENIAAK